ARRAAARARRGRPREVPAPGAQARRQLRALRLQVGRRAVPRAAGRVRPGRAGRPGAPRAGAARASRQGGDPMSKRRILVVDDDEAVLTFWKAKLAARYEVLTTSSPESVLAMARREQPE